MLNQRLEEADIVSRFCRYQLVVKKNLPIRSSEMGLLIYVSKQTSPITPLEISEFFHISKPTVTEMISRLINSNYLGKIPSPEDRRSYTLVITEQGQALVETALNDYLKSMELLKIGLGDDEYGVLMSILQKANKIFEKEMEK
ncbi:MAG: MarR family transcriptional regulator [Erysipelotrichaceae bacterium]|nr:MAG: MarR family transcriptional [Erysipelotrichaceae bacterium]TXT18618.1 MAG: MarR family transcriptional regulator [Erysipelotrichaceae bacterium]